MQRQVHPAKTPTYERIALYFNPQHKNSMELKDFVNTNNLQIECIRWDPSLPRMPSVPAKPTPHDFPIIRVTGSEGTHEFRGKQAFDFVNKVFVPESAETLPQSRSQPEPQPPRPHPQPPEQPSLPQSTRQVVAGVFQQSPSGQRALRDILAQLTEQEAQGLNKFFGLPVLSLALTTQPQPLSVEPSAPIAVKTIESAWSESGITSSQNKPSFMMVDPEIRKELKKGMNST